MDVRRRATPGDQGDSIAGNAGQRIKRLALKVRSKFEYTFRFLVFLIPCIFVALAFGALIFLGAISTYICNTLGMPWAAFTSVWGSLLLSEVWLILNAIFLIRHSGFYLFLLFNIATLVGLTGLLLSLNFSFIQNTLAAAKLFERALFSAFMYPSAALLTWSVITIYGVHNAAYFLAVFLSVAYYCFGIPQKSCYRLFPGQDGDPFGPDVIICNRFDNFHHTLSVIFLPAFFYLSIYYRVIFDLFHLSNFLTLLFGGFLVVGVLKDKHSLWWTGLPEHSQKILGNLLTHTSVIILIVVFLEYRIVFTAFKSFVQLPSPFSYLFVGASLYALYGAMCLHLVLGPERIRKFSLAFFGAICSSFVLGLPWYMYFSPIVGSQALMAFYFRQQLMDWIVFVVSLMAGLMWFMKVNFMFLFYPFYVPYYGFLSMSEVSIILMVAFFFSLVLPGFVIMDRFPKLNTFFLICHSALVLSIEWLLHKDGLEMYPSYLVIFTSVVAIFVFYRSYLTGRISYTAATISCGIYFAKFSLVISYSPSSIVAFTLLCVSLSELVIFRPVHEPMHVIKGVVHVAIIFFGGFFSMEIQREFLHMNDALRMLSPNCSFLTFFLSLLTLSYRSFYFTSGSPGTSGSSSSLNVILQKISLFGIAFTMLATLFGVDIIEAIETGGYNGGGFILNKFFFELVGFCVICAMVLSGVIPVATSAPARIFASIGLGLFGGLCLPYLLIPSDSSSAPLPFIAFLSFPFLLTLFLLLTFSLFFLTTSTNPASSSPSPFSSSSFSSTLPPSILALLFSLILALFPVLYVIESEIFGLSAEEARNFHMALFGGYILMTSILSLIIKNKKLLWMIYLGNISTIFAVLFAVSANLIIFPTSSIFSLPFILPFFLLLQQDDFLFSWLTPFRRFFPVVFFFFFLSDLLLLLQIIELSQFPPFDVLDNLWGFLGVEILAFLFTIAPQVFIITGCFTYPSLDTALPLVLTLPLCFITLVLTHLNGSRVLALVDIVAGISLWLMSGKSAPTKQAVN